MSDSRHSCYFIFLSGNLNDIGTLNLLSYQGKFVKTPFPRVWSKVSWGQSCIAVQNWIEVLNSIQFFPWTWWSIQIQFIDQKLNLNCCSTHHWTFLNWVQSQFRESGVPPTKKGKELPNFVHHGKEKAHFLLFSTV